MRQALLRIITAAGSTALTLTGCGSTEPPVPTTVQIDSASLSFAAIGQTRQLTAAVKDQRGDPFGSPTITWSVANTAVATVDGSGLVTATGPGMTQVTATDESAAATITVGVVQVPAQVQKVSGDGQSGPPGQELPGALTVQINDAGGHPVANIGVGFTLAEGTATIATPSAVTGADGRVSTKITPVTLGPVQIRAGVDANIGAVFAITSASQFNIQIRFLTEASPSQMQAFADAEHKWESLIVGDIPDVPLNVAAGTCGQSSPAINETVDDLIILVTLVPIDGVGQVLGAAGPCFIRSNGGLSIVGAMRLDTDDLDALEAQGLLEDVILHEMGHVIGFGTLWDTKNLLVGAIGTGGSDPHFVGTDALLAFNDEGGASYSASAKVPVEDMGGPGTADAHWRELVFDNELMTGFINFGTNPLSGITVASLADLGYQVNMLGADTYSLAPSPILRAGPRRPPVSLGKDVLRIPIGVVGTSGEVLDVIRP